MNFDVYFHHVFVLFKDKAGILMKQKRIHIDGNANCHCNHRRIDCSCNSGICVTAWKNREATDLANVRSAYAQVSTEALLGDSETTVTVDLKQKQADWQSVDPVNTGGIVHYKTQGDTVNWIGVAAPNGTCVVSYKEDYGIILTWSGKADPSISKEILKKGEKFSSLEEAYDAYLKALGDSKYDSVRQSQS